jgi:mRNA interferase MazF
MLCWCFSHTQTCKLPSRVLIKLNSSAGEGSGLLTDSVVMTDNLATISEIAIDRVIGKIR